MKIVLDLGGDLCYTAFIINEQPENKTMTMPNVNDIIAYENGEMDEAEAIEFFQGMIVSGVVWQLQGSYGRTAKMLIDNDICLTASEFIESQKVAEEGVYV